MQLALYILCTFITIHSAVAQNAVMNGQGNTTVPEYVDPCPLPLRFNAAIMNCSAPCIVTTYNISQLNAIRIFMVVMAWVNCVFLGCIIFIYSVWAPSKWVHFPANMMLIQLAISVFYQSQYMFSTGKSYKGYLCKDDFHAIDQSDLVCSWQGAWGIFWSHIGAVWICMIGLQLFLTVNGLLPKVVGSTRLTIYLGITIVSSLVSVLICHFLPERPWGINSFGYCTSRNFLAYRWAFAFPVTLFSGVAHFFLLWSAVVIWRKSGFSGLARQKRLLLFTGAYVIMIDWILINVWLGLHRAPAVRRDIFAWIACSIETGNDPSCKPEPRLSIGYQIITAIFLSTISTAIGLVYTLTSETFNLFGTVVTSAGTALGFSSEAQTAGYDNSSE